jgi:hypothetical protein
MLITVKVHGVRNRNGRLLLQARGYMPNGQELIRGAIHEGHDAFTQGAAVTEVCNWIRDNRPGFELRADHLIWLDDLKTCPHCGNLND